jgi:uncharacterized protein
MPDQDVVEIALAGHQQVPADWMPASQVAPFIFDDPAIVWLEHHGAAYGFQPDTSPYELGDFIAEKARQFEQKWIEEMAPGAVQVCRSAEEACDAGRVRETFALMQQGTPLIAQPALWWAPERIYGAPDLLVHTAWVRAHFPRLMDDVAAHAAAPHLGQAGLDGHYVVLDLKFITKLDDSGKATDLASYAAQVRLCSFMLGQLQGLMPGQALLVTRDRVADPLPVSISSQLDQPLDGDLAAIRDRYVEIKVNGARYAPWKDEIVAANPSHQDDRWRTAKEIIARDKTPGGDSRLVYQIGASASRQLASAGYTSLAALLAQDPRDIPLEAVKGIGGKRASQIRAILAANRSRAAVLPPGDRIPPRKTFEFYVDFEYFTNVNVDFEKQWPTLDGCEMVYMIGVGWEEGRDWHFKALVAEQESQDQELAIGEELIGLLRSMTDGAILDGSRTALYHWTSADVWQTRRVAERHQLAADHPLRRLPWCDLQQVFLEGPAALPGAWGFGLKEAARALGALNPAWSTHWPEDLDVGSHAMVMAWRAYQTAEPARSAEIGLIKRYLEADCCALRQILGWLCATGHGGENDGQAVDDNRI